VALALGPTGDEPEPFDLLAEIFREHRSRFDSTDWCVGYFERGTDARLDDGDFDETCAGLPGLPRAGE
jgi:hypothetical protein